MLPTYYACNSCREEFHFQFREAWYYVGTTPVVNNRVAVGDLLSLNVRPGWCMDCECLCLVEDIEPVRVFEDAYGAARAGRAVEYPLHSAYMEAARALREIGNLLRWRMARMHPARALCCGGLRFQFMDVAQPLLKHAGCEFGFIDGLHQIGGGSWKEPGIEYPAGTRLYDAEGVLIGQLIWRKDDERMWDIEALTYPRGVVDDQAPWRDAADGLGHVAGAAIPGMA